MERTWSCLECQFSQAAPLCTTPDGVTDFRRLARLLLNTVENLDELTGQSRIRAYSCVTEMVQEAPEAGVAFLLAAINECRTGAHVELLSVSALEPLLTMHGASVIAPLEQAAQQHAKVRYLLSAARDRPAMPAALWERLIAIVTPGPVIDANAPSPGAGMHDRVPAPADIEALLGEPM